MIKDQDTIIGLSIKDLRNIMSGRTGVDNANLQKTPETTHKTIADLVAKDFYLKMLPKELSNLHKNGFIHIHDIEYFGTRPFCRSYDARNIFMYGFKPDGGMSAIDAGPAMHAEVAVLQLTKLLEMGQVFHAGGQGALFGIVFLSPFLKGKTYKEIKQLMQMMIYELNQSYVSRGGQVVFSSINISPGVPNILKNVPIVYQGILWDGKIQPYGKVDHGIYSENIIYPRKVYGDYEREVRLAFKAIMEIALDGDFYGKPFPFPKLEVTISKEFIDTKTWELAQDDAPSYHDLYKSCFGVASKWSSIYFDNLLIESRKSDSSIACTQCCSYQFADDSDTDSKFNARLNFENGEHFKLGGMQVCSINLPRAGYQSNHDDKILITKIYNLMDSAMEIFKIKKELIRKQSISGNLSFITQTTPTGISFTEFDELVYEIGIVGFVEMLEYHCGEPLITEFGINNQVLETGKKILSQMREYCKLLSEFNNIKIVLSRTPAETTSQRFAVCDLLDSDIGEIAKDYIKGDLKTAIMNMEKTRNLPIYYSNGFAPDVNCDVHYRIEVESAFWEYVDGGAITHIWLSEEDPDVDSLMDFTLKLLKNSNIGYLTYTKDLSQCTSCKKMMSGIQTKCKFCNNEEIIIFSRITGYYSSAGIMTKGIFNRRWNSSKAEELFNRKKISIEDLITMEMINK